MMGATVTITMGVLPISLIFKASSQRPTSTERTFYRFNYLTLWCEVAPPHKELYVLLLFGFSLSISAAKVVQQRLKQQKRRNENRKTDNA
jgi:hypothetical protein